MRRENARGGGDLKLWSGRRERNGDLGGPEVEDEGCKAALAVGVRAAMQVETVCFLSSAECLG